MAESSFLNCRKQAYSVIVKKDADQEIVPL
jgi:hypothetical protein